MQFDFVTEENKPYNRRDTATRHLIRKRATQAAARTKKDARATSATSHAATNQEQCPKSRPKNRQRGAEGSIRSTGLEAQSLTVYPSPPSSSVASLSQGSRAFSEDDVIIDESHRPQLYEALTMPWRPPEIAGFVLSEQVQAILIGKIMSTCIVQRDHIRLSKMVGLTSPDFVSTIPAQYGRDPCLDAAIDCLSSRIQDFIPSLTTPVTSSATLYGRALKQLQCALDRSDGQRQYDLWLAVPLLCIYELLSSERHHSWVLHAKGAATMLKHIGAHNVTTKLHKALLMTQAPIMVTEGIFTGTSCYLDEADWGKTIQSCLDISSGDYDPRSPLVVSLVLIMRHLPNLLLRTENVVLHGQIDDEPHLQHDLELLKSDFDDFHTKWASILSTKRLHYVDDELRMVRLASAYAGSALCERLLYALSPSGNRSLESSALRSSTLVQEITNHAATHVPNAHARIALPAIVASSIVESSSEWMAAANMPRTGAVLDSEVFGKWSQAIRPFWQWDEADRK